ncbi:MAG: RluA family pseudouridine synthase [Planctomycetota bacterium]|jgi:23S rRNA pseudouridine1911/1915/1917 synthase
MGEIEDEDQLHNKEELEEDETVGAAKAGPDIRTFSVKGESVGSRIDLYIASRFARLSRSGIQRLVKSGAILVNGAKVKPSHSLSNGDEITMEIPEPPPRKLAAEYLPLDILYEDEIMLVVNKPPGIVVHPARGHWGGTLINAVLYHCHKLSHIAPGRPGIVHRLDRDTTGVILFMKEDWSHRHVARQFEHRRVEKEYLAIVEGEMEHDDGWISLPLGRHPRSTRKMAVRIDIGREAQTYYKVLERFRGYTFVSAMPKTGRTHQIRVHLAASGHPVAADELYSKSGPVYLSQLEDLAERPSDEPPLMGRQALHARRLNVEYPGKKERIEFEAPLPGDMEAFMAALRRLRLP